MSNYAKKYSFQSVGELDEELKHGKFILNLADLNLIDACKDVSDGGIGIALAEICIMSNIGCKIKSPKNDEK